RTSHAKPSGNFGRTNRETSCLRHVPRPRRVPTRRPHWVALTYNGLDGPTSGAELPRIHLAVGELFDHLSRLPPVHWKQIPTEPTAGEVEEPELALTREARHMEHDPANSRKADDTAEHGVWSAALPLGFGWSVTITDRRLWLRDLIRGRRRFQPPALSFAL